MKIRTLLLAGTSLAMVSFTPMAFAQDAAPAEGVSEACIAAGFQTMEACMAAQQSEPGSEAAEPSPEPAPVEPEPAPVEPAPAPEQPVPQEPGPEQQPQELPPAVEPTPEPQPTVEQPVPQAPAEQPVQPAEPVQQQPVEPQEPVPEQPVQAEPAPEAPAAVEPLQPVQQPEASPADAMPELFTPEEPGQAAPEAGQQPAADAAAPTAPVDPAAPVDPTAAQPAAPAQQPAAPIDLNATVSTDAGAAVDAGVPSDQVTEVLPEGVSPEAAAPLLDSAKAPDAAAPADASQQVVPVDPNTPPPASDAEAQATAQVSVEVTSVVAEQGTQLEAAPEFQAPPSVTVVEQTNVTNNVTVNLGTVYQVNGGAFIRNPQRDRDRLILDGDTTYYEELANGRIRETITRPDGSKVVTVRNRYGDVVRRSRISPDNREYVLAYFDDRYEADLVEYRDPAAGLPPLRLTIAPSEYVLDTRTADAATIEVFFSQPPVDQVYRIYSIDEVKRSARIRDTVRRVEIGDLNFDTGAATIPRDQVQSLQALATAIQSILSRNPGETFLIEGHTDAVGDEVSNLQLSDARAATVAQVLSEFYDIPPENLATQGYGEQFLKVRTDGEERANRRVTVRRITSLVTPVAQNQ